jgi:hypothetical protein
MQVSSVVENELSLGLRGMAVEDDHGQYRQQSNGVASHSAAAPQVRAPPLMVQGRPPYGSYPQADYSSYYTNGATRDHYMDYGYGYSAQTDPSLYPSSAGMNNTSTTSLYPGVSPQALHPNAHAGQQSSMYYDYSASARSPSQYYYPAHQPIMYPTMAPLSPMPTPQLSAAAPTGAMPDKKQVRFLRHVVSLISLTLGPSMDCNNRWLSNTFCPTMISYTPRQVYAADYGAQIPFMIPNGAMYGPAAHGIPFYHHNVRPGRRQDTSESLALRSPLLDEFRANKSHKWELRVCQMHN